MVSEFFRFSPSSALLLSDEGSIWFKSGMDGGGVGGVSPPFFFLLIVWD